MTTKYPPQISIAEAIRVIKDMYNKHNSKDVPIDLMPEILAIKEGSSHFPAAITALHRFGLIDKISDGIVELTDLAMGIIKPFGDEDSQARKTLFQKDKILAGLIDKYPNGLLPSEDQLEQTLIKVLGVPRETVKKWLAFVMESFTEFPRGYTKNATSTISPHFQTSIPPLNTREEKIQNHSNYQNIELPSGKKFYFHLDEGFNLEDLEFITDFFELKKKRAKN